MVWIVQPRDEGGFQGTQPVNEVTCVSTAQVYLDLASHPERAKEAADRLRADLLQWPT